MSCSFPGDDLNGSVVLIGQDGLQLPPLSFPPGSLLPFLTCLEQGLSPQGRLDPPLTLAQMNSGSLIKRNALKERLGKLTDDKSKTESQDFVFRLINGVKTSAIGKAFPCQYCHWFFCIFLLFIISIFVVQWSPAYMKQLF